MLTKPAIDSVTRSDKLRRLVAGPLAAAVLCSFSAGCREQSMPKGVGASGKSIQVSPDSVNKVPDDVLHPQPGSGKGGGGGDGQGRLRNPEVAGKAKDHDPGSRKKAEEAEKAKQSPAPSSPAKDAKPADPTSEKPKS